jgi:hypothetical protein
MAKKHKPQVDPFANDPYVKFWRFMHRYFDLAWVLALAVFVIVMVIRNAG